MMPLFNWEGNIYFDECSSYKWSAYSAQSIYPTRSNIDTQAKANKLRRVPKNRKEFAREVQRVNRKFPASYDYYLVNIAVHVALHVIAC